MDFSLEKNLEPLIRIKVQRELFIEALCKDHQMEVIEELEKYGWDIR